MFVSKPFKRINNLIGEAFGVFFSALMNVFDLVLSPVQRVIGVNRMGYVFLLPNSLIFGVFVLFPMVLNIFYAGTSGTQLFLSERTYVGTDNFEVLLTCEDYRVPNSCKEDLFWRAVYNTLFFVIFKVSGIIFFSLITALILNRGIVARGFFRSIFFYPVLLSPVVVALIWKWILQRDGLLNALLIQAGYERQPFLLSTDWAMFWVITVSVWAQMGFYTLILLAGLQSVPGVLYEASEIDGANSWQSFRYITLPLLMPTMFVVLVLSLIRAVQAFDEVFVLTGGGPGTATQFIVQYIYDTGFANQVQRFGLASAASVVLGVALLIFTLFQLRLGRSAEAT